jgi:predicted pyridoxine 5'-phosphate oxidase superfamily flavin-nucleotide-binding protein
MSVFHEGERAVQEQAGVRDRARRVGNAIHTEIPPAAQDFLEQPPFVLLGGQDAAGQVWASALFGAPGFVSALDEHTVEIDALPSPGDPLYEVLQAADQYPVGLLAIEPETRRRMRINGFAEVRPGGFTLSARQVYANCPKYIQARHFTATESSYNSTPATSGVSLTPAQAAAIASADTFYIASVHQEGGADVSHRGGNPGFIHLENERTLLFPDYSGNSMFNTLGNIVAHPGAGLLFLDYATGNMMHLTGEARIVWDTAAAARFAGAERLVEFTVRQVVERPGASPLRAGGVEFSPFNP